MGGDPTGTPHCQNTDGTEQTCINASNCNGLATIETGGTCTIQCVVPDPCFQNGDPTGTPVKVIQIQNAKINRLVFDVLQYL